MRKPKMKDDEVLKLLKQGWTLEAVGREFGCSSQNISLKRQRFIRDGLLPPKHRARRTVRKEVNDVGVVIRGKKFSTSEIPVEVILKDLTVEQLEKISFMLYDRAMKYPGFKEKIRGLENKLAAAQDRIKQLEGMEKKLAERELKMAAIKKGSLVEYGD